MAIDKKALKKMQRKKIYQRNRNKSTSSLNIYKSTAASYAIKAAENSNEDNNAGVSAVTFSSSSCVIIAGRVSHRPKGAKKAVKNAAEDIEESLSEGLTDKIIPEEQFISHQRAINQSVRSQTQLFNGHLKPKTNLYKKNRQKLYKRLQNKCRDIKANIIHNIKSIPKKIKSRFKKKIKDAAMHFLKLITASIMCIILSIVFPILFMLMFVETSTPGIVAETFADIQYAYPADENDITRATIHWQTLIISLNNRYSNVPNMVTDHYDKTKTEKCNIMDDTHKILSFLSAYFGQWTFDDDVRSFMTQIFNEMYVIEYGFTSEQKTLTSIVEFNKSELPNPLPDNYKVMSEYKNAEGIEIAIVSVSEIKEYITLNYSIKENMNFEDILNKYLTELQKENYVMYYERKGGAIKAFSSPFAFDWTNMITSTFGYRQWDDGSTEFHKGLDFGVPNGTEILAIADGIVNVGTGCTHNYPKNGSCGCNGGFGNYVEITCDDGTIILYGHMSQVNVTNGQIIKNGQVIGLSGCTGWSTGFHTHLQMVKNGEYIDPMTFIKPYSGNG